MSKATPMSTGRRVMAYLAQNGAMLGNAELTPAQRRRNRHKMNKNSRTAGAVLRGSDARLSVGGADLTDSVRSLTLTNDGGKPVLHATTARNNRRLRLKAARRAAGNRRG